MSRKQYEKEHLPKLLFQAIGTSSRSFPSSIFLLKIILNTIQKGEWQLPTSRFNSNNTIGYNKKKNQVIESQIHTLKKDNACNKQLRKIIPKSFSKIIQTVYYLQIYSV